ncbi:hypothetical protein [Demequina muriae]|uniref:SdpI/YhfL protein family protein n=1 Tax=Demequina muriae TaxID=3051664 RepID=A0ABT8GFR8_9MICO|nr:hypothetical protein [Demequina sp. EGI L300058]MDN4480260.1 hypothetical protein [Demequina sp. EGI L300058]
MKDTDPDTFLALASIAATLLGTFTVAAVFYIGSDTHRRPGPSAAVDDYWRSGMRWIFAAYSIPMLVALAFAALEPVWGAVTFIALTGVLVTTTVSTVRHVLRPDGPGNSRDLKVNEWATAVGVLVSAVLPWALGGWVPSPPFFIPSLLLVLAAGFTSTAALVLAEFDADTGSTEMAASAAHDDSA